MISACHSVSLFIVFRLPISACCSCLAKFHFDVNLEYSAAVAASLISCDLPRWAKPAQLHYDIWSGIIRFGARGSTADKNSRGTDGTRKARVEHVPCHNHHAFFILFVSVFVRLGMGV